MRTQQFLEHHGVASNPFAEEDAQTDPVFKEHCIDSTYHPTWDKIYGDPAEPATSLVFGEKGSGKTALRLQIVRHLAAYNRQHPRGRLFVIEYDDFNPFLDRFRDRLSGRRRKTSDRVLAEWKLWDHMDAILSLGVTGLVDRILDVRHPTDAAGADAGPIDARELDRHQARDLLLLAACYDQSSAETPKGRWHRLRRKLRYHTFRRTLDLAFAWVVDAAVLGLLAWLGKWEWFLTPWPYVVMAAAWIPWLIRAWKRGSMARGITEKRAGRQSGQAAAAAGADALHRPRDHRPAAAHQAADRRPLRAVSQVPGHSANARLRWHRGAGRSSRRTPFDQRFGGADAGAVVADARQQISQASRHRLQAAAADRAGPVHRSRGSRVLSAGPTRQAEHDSLAGMDRARPCTTWPPPG